MPKQPKTRASETSRALQNAADELEQSLAEHHEALQDGFGGPLDGDAVRALQNAVGVLRASRDDVERALLVGEWTAERALEALEPLDVGAELVEAPAALPVAQLVQVPLKRGGVARISGRGVSEPAPGYTVAIYAADVTATAPDAGTFATALVAGDDDELAKLVATLAA
jgi:hypothetical protein